MGKTNEKRDVQVGGFTTRGLQRRLQQEAKANGRSVSSHLHKILEERYAPAKKGD